MSKRDNYKIFRFELKITKFVLRKTKKRPDMWSVYQGVVSFLNFFSTQPFFSQNKFSISFGFFPQKLYTFATWQLM